MPRSRGTRKRVAPGIYLDSHGYSAVVVVGSGTRRQQREKRFPHGTSLRTMQRWQTRTRADLQGAQPKRPRKGSLTVAVRTYLPTIATRACYQARAAELAAWVKVFGDRDRALLTTVALQAQLERWSDAGVAANTLNHRITSLRALYTALDGADGDSPAAGLRRYRAPDPEPRALAYDDVDAILGAMPESDTQARLRVMAYTGLPNIRLGRLQPEHIDWKGRAIWLEGRRKGKGTKPKRMPLLDVGVAALKTFAARNAWGTFSRSGAWISFDRARKRVNKVRMEEAEAAGTEPTLIPPCRPYDLRHTFGTYAYLTTRDIKATAELLDCTVDTAMRYARAAVQPNVQAIVDALNAKGWPPRLDP